MRADGPPGRGTLYWFNEEEFGEALDESLASDHLAGRLVRGQRALVIQAPEGVNRFAVLARGSLNGSVSWVAEWGGGDQLLVGLEPETTLLEAERLIAALQERGFKCDHRTVGEVLSAGQFRRVTKSLETVGDGANA
ncbi:MAG TPA: hypothetical protein VFK14_06550 [Solirubrobacterales bacterium]|nr:hypothetical protein [Solirubrobacterales bacterium]